LVFYLRWGGGHRTSNHQILGVTIQKRPPWVTNAGPWLLSEVVLIEKDLKKQQTLQSHTPVCIAGCVWDRSLKSHTNTTKYSTRCVCVERIIFTQQLHTSQNEPRTGLSSLFFILRGRKLQSHCSHAKKRNRQVATFSIFSFTNTNHHHLPKSKTQMQTRLHFVLRVTGILGLHALYSERNQAQNHQNELFYFTYWVRYKV
jgi:hypothetical protein